jgi:hypothetical protein
MTVESPDEGAGPDVEVACVWFERGALKTGRFKAAVLEYPRRPKARAEHLSLREIGRRILRQRSEGQQETPAWPHCADEPCPRASARPLV